MNRERLSKLGAGRSAELSQDQVRCIDHHRVGCKQNVVGFVRFRNRASAVHEKAKVICPDDARWQNHGLSDSRGTAGRKEIGIAECAQ